MIRPRAAVCSILLVCAALLPAAAPAQTSSLPILTPTQTLAPTDQETYPTPGSFPAQLYFGATMALSEKTLMVSMVGYNNQTGRIALFSKGRDGQWVRTGSIDPTPPLAYDTFGPVALSHDYLMAAADTGTSLFHESQGTWLPTDKLNGVLPWSSMGLALDPPWMFIVNDVYRIGPHGRLTKTQTLGDPQSSLGAADAAQGGTLAIGDTSNPVQGGVYVFSLRHGQWVEKQQLTASNGVLNDAFGIGISISGDLMAIIASGRNLRYEDPACPGTYYTGGAVYIFKRIRGWWTEQQEIDAQCVFFVQVGLSQEWLAVNAGTDNVVYHRAHEQGSEMFVPFGHTGPDLFAYSMKLFGSTLVVGTGASEEFPPGQVYVYDLRDKGK
jgi:FG-GAP repeat protein